MIHTAWVIVLVEALGLLVVLSVLGLHEWRFNAWRKRQRSILADRDAYLKRIAAERRALHDRYTRLLNEYHRLLAERDG